MTTSTLTRPLPGQPVHDVTGAQRRAALLPAVTAAVAFLILFWQPLQMLVQDWWAEPDAGHGLLLGPLALFIGYRKGVSPEARPQVALGLIILFGALILRYASGVAAEFFTMRFSLLSAAIGLVIYRWGLVQVRHWWLSATLLLLAIPLPQVVLSSLALPLQFNASNWGATMLGWRHVPVLLQGNVLHLPGQSLFVTEACSGLRSLTALISLGVLISGLWLQTPVARILLVLLAIPIAMLLNAIRIFITGFLVYYVDPSLGAGVMHYTEGWALFVVAFLLLGAVAWVVVRAERLVGTRRNQ